MARVWTPALVAFLVAVPVAGQPPAAPAPNPPVILGFDQPTRPKRPAQPPTPPPAGPRRLDRHGDALPAGALARFGSVRLRHNDLSGLGFTQDGKHLVSISAGDNGLRVWEPATGKEVARLNTPIQTAVIAPDRTILYVADGKVLVWEPLGTGRIRELLRTLPDVGITAIGVHPGGKVFAAAVPGGIALIDLTTGDHKADLRVPGDQPPITIKFSPDGRWVAAAGPRTGVWLWNLATLRRVRTYPAPDDQLDFAFSPDGSRLVVAGGPLAVFHTDSEEAVEGFTPPPEVQVQTARFAADGKSLFALRPDGTLDRLDAATGEAKDSWPAAEGVAAQPPLAIAPNAAWVAAMDDTGGIRVWNPKDGTGPVVERLSPLLDLGFSADGKVASAVTLDGKKVVTFDPATGAPGPVLETGLGTVNGVTWSARLGLAVGVGTGTDDAEVHVVDVARKKVVTKFPVPAESFPKVAFSSADPTRVGLIVDGTATVYDTLTGRPVRAFNVGPPEVTQVGVLSPDCRLFAVSTNPASVWEVATGRKRFEVGCQSDPLAMTFSPDGRRLAVTDAERVYVLDLRTGTVVRRLHAPGPDPMFTDLAFSPDGTKLATGLADGVVILWDVTTGEALVTFDRHEGPVSGVTFSADGTRLLTASYDGTAIVWDATARPAAPAPLTGTDEAFGLLASPDPAVAHRGIAFLDRTPDSTVKLLADRVPVPTAIQPARIARLVTDLGNADFQTRQAAAKELESFGAEAVPALRAVASVPPNPEVRRLAGDLLTRLAGPPTRAEDLRAIRAVEVLEVIGTPAARDVLTKWAAGPANHRLTTEAAAALRRLPARP